MRISIPYGLFLLALLAGAAVASTSFSTGPPPARTGAPAVGGLPAEANCTSCHITFDDFGSPVPNLDLPGGGIELILPGTYTSGQTYPIEVRVWSDSTAALPDRRWGFQLTAFFASNGQGAGTFDLGGSTEMRILSVPFGPFQSRRYVEHSLEGTRPGAAGPVSWHFQWQAPPNGEKVYFAAAANAADGRFDSTNDFIYTTLDSVFDVVTPVHAASWGSIKRRWR